LSPFPVTLDFSGTTQFGSAFSVNALDQDGYTSGRLAGFSIGADGVILGRYTNGQSAVLGQVVLANFANPNGLQQMGNNMWAETATSARRWWARRLRQPGRAAVVGGGRFQRRPDCRTGQHDHRAARVSGQRADHPRRRMPCCRPW